MAQHSLGKLHRTESRRCWASGLLAQVNFLGHPVRGVEQPVDDPGNSEDSPNYGAQHGDEVIEGLPLLGDHNLQPHQGSLPHDPYPSNRCRVLLVSQRMQLC
jgi:hypothetical protein